MPRLFSALSLLLAFTCAQAQPSIVGRWFGDDESFSITDRVFEITNSKTGTLTSGGFQQAVSIIQKGAQLIATIEADGDDTPQKVILILDADGRLHMTSDLSGTGGCYFRNASDLQFVKPLLGNWAGPDAWGTIERSGWATIHMAASGKCRFRLEMKKEGLTWSVRLFQTRLYTPLQFDPTKNTLTVGSEIPWKLIRETK